MLARSLGIPPELLAGSSAAQLYMKWYRSPQGKESSLLYSEMLPEAVQQVLQGGVAELEIKWFEAKAGLLGAFRLPQELQFKWERVRAATP